MVSIRNRKRKEKREEQKGIWLPALLFFLFFPSFISCFGHVEKETLAEEEKAGQIWVVQKQFWGSRRIALEEYLIGMVAATMPAEYEMETLKAQAIILRSSCVSEMKKEDGKKIVEAEGMEEYYFSRQERKALWGEEADRLEEKIRQAVIGTKGQILVSDGRILQPPFCRMSNGTTRDITEYTSGKKQKIPVSSVVCEEDKKAEDFIQYMEVSEKEFRKTIKKLTEPSEEKTNKIILYRDEKDYVKKVQIGEQWIDGEKFRKAFGILSSCFTMEKLGNAIEVQTRGIGHGFGFSQYQANQMALDGKDYEYLLYYFFTEISLERI